MVAKSKGWKEHRKQQAYIVLLFKMDFYMFGSFSTSESAFSSLIQIFLTPTTYSGKLFNSVPTKNIFWSCWIRGLVASLVDPQLSCGQNRLTSACSFPATHDSTGLHHSLLRHPFPGWILKSNFLSHSSFGREPVSMTILVLLVWISLIFTLYCELGDSRSDSIRMFKVSYGSTRVIIKFFALFFTCFSVIFTVCFTFFTAA